MIREVILSGDGEVIKRYGTITKDKKIKELFELMREPDYDKLTEILFENEIYGLFPKQVSLAIGETCSLIYRKCYKIIVFDLDPDKCDFASIRRYSFNKPIVYNVIGGAGLHKIATWGVVREEDNW